MSRERTSGHRATRKLKHAVETMVVQGVGALARALPRAAADAFGRGLGRAALAFGVRASLAEANLARAFPERSLADRSRIRAATYAHLGAAAIDLLRYPLRTPAELDVMARTTPGMEHIGAARAAGRGVILLTGHFGAFEVLGAAIARAGHPVHFLVRAQSNPRVDAIVQAARRALGVGVIAHGGGVREALEVLRTGECLAMVADQDAGADGEFVDFFGTPASTPRGPAEFAVRTGAPIVMGFERRLPGGRYAGEILPPIVPPSSGDHLADVRALTALHTQCLERWVRAYPEQWLWTHRRWKTRPPAAATSAAAAVASTGARALARGAATLLVAALVLAGGTRPARAVPPDTLRAGDSAFDGAGSSVFPLGPTRVRRLFEGVRIHRQPGGWRIDAEEVFQAGVSSVTAAMGLPDYRASLPSDSATAQPRGTVRRLRVTVDGLPMGFSEAPGWAAPGADLGGLERLYRFEVPFSPEEIRTVRLEYEIGESRTDRGEPLLFFYLNPGALWAGDAAKVTVSVDLGDVDPEDLIPGWLRPGGYRLYERQVLWHRRPGDEVADIALAFRSFDSPLAAMRDSVRGPLALADEAREAWLGRLTPREARFWLDWFARRRPARADRAPEKERQLVIRLTERIASFERARIDG